ncbi:pimeloyl-ACP methyl ester carboxylesterase [Yoonia maritima]|uniref:Pimeloyl-ACP methyl ester carboxylesterase n=1 Tax=Yoonia maritima TaxID=1435347 RepID=A0A2T0VUR7_9RHOB|nr:alpha/beta hydrolase [Yoonia maritima]PRY75202.1 pimeloyl-ACP methyl ester carboxylesterase [Yoonia maritima]
MSYLVYLGLFVFVAALPIILELRRKPVSEEERGQTTGDLAQLSQGVTHYRWIGPVRGPVAVVVHGVSTSSVAVEGLAHGLGELGYRVLVYDLYGRGLSAVVSGRQNRAFFLQQLTDMLEHQGLTEDITLVGYSMGGSIATAFASENPHYIKRVILVAPAGVMTEESKFSRFCRRFPLIGDWAHGVFARRRARKAIPRSGNSQMASTVYAAQRQELKRRGYLPAVLSSRRGILSEVQEADHRRLARLDVPTIAIWAEKDHVIPIRALGVMAQWHRDVLQEVVPDAGHAMPYTHCPQLMQAIGKALRS